MQVIIVTNGTAEEVAALALAVQERQPCAGNEELTMGPGVSLVLNA